MAVWSAGTVILSQSLFINVSERCHFILDIKFCLPLKLILSAGSATQQDVMMSMSSVGASEGMASKFGRLPFPTQTAMRASLATEIYHFVQDRY